MSKGRQICVTCVLSRHCALRLISSSNFDFQNLIFLFLIFRPLRRALRSVLVSRTTMIIKLYGHSAIERDHGRHLWPRWGACKRGRDNMATAWWRSARPSWVSDAPENIWWTFDERAADSDPVDRVSRVTRVTVVRERGVARYNNAIWWTCGKCGSWWTRRKSDPVGACL